jgi:ligand-binding sensor domain-containing protein
MKNYSVKDGLPSSEVYHVMQDSKGYLWFCTDGGVSRYDGYSFKNYSSRKGLKDNTVFGSFEDSKGKIWFRTLSGRLYYFEGDSIYSIPANERISSEIRNGVITSLYVDSGDTIWCGVMIGKGYYKIAPPYRGIDFSLHKIQDNCFAIEIEKKGIIWGTVISAAVLGTESSLPTIDGGINCYSKTGKRLSVIYSVSVNPASRMIRTTTGGYLITGKKEVYNGRTKELLTTSGNSFISLYEGRNQELWVGQMKQGVHLFPKGSLHSPQTSLLLDKLSVSSILEDREGGYWFTTLEKGVFYMASTVFLYYNEKNGLTDDKVSSVIVRDNKSVLVGLENGSICTVGPEGVKVVKKRPDSLLTNNIYRLSRCSVKDLVICGASYSYEFDLFKKFAPEYLSNQYSNIAYKCFTLDKKGNLWCGNALTLDQLDPVKKVIVQRFQSKSRILSLRCGPGDTIWVGCVNGLWAFKDGMFRYQGIKNELFTSRMEDIQMSSDSTWWFATKGEGLIVKRKNDFFRITEQEGLSSNMCKSIYPDDSGMVWISTNRGINRIVMKNWKDYKIESYSSDEGLLTNEINQIVRTGDQIWAATNQGLITFNEKKLFSNSSPPPVYITGLEINSAKRPLADTLHLKYFENYLNINFIGLSYMRNSRLRYRYQMEGLDTGWTSTQLNAIQYTTLPPGKYCFRVNAINSAGVASIRPAQFYFIISKPFWKEWWFILVVALTLLSITVTSINYRINKLRKVAVEKSDITRKMAELKLVALRAQMNPHFIFNSINSIQLFILKNDTESAHKHLSRFSKLMRQVLENSRHEFITLEKELSALELYVELERLRFSYKFNFTISYGEGVEPEHMLISPLIIQPYIENAIWHGLMHLVDIEGELFLRIEIQGEVMKCIIEDNGIGRKKSLGYKKDTSHKSAGMSLNKERVETINALNKSKLSVEFIDKLNPDGSPGGTRVEVFLPFLRS